jgi:hypothetical protein
LGISRRLRYEVLRRDSYTCRYCGAKAPEVKITADHVIPVALGGTDEPSNLVAACEACNGGKTSSSPDAPVVADVSEDALRWSRAMAAAADQMRAEFAKRQDIYGQFDEWWGRWTYGFKNLPLPRPADWRNSVDSFLAAGLPLDVLKWCADKAGASKAAPDQTWRYMCGIAWKKVNELQGAAQAIAGTASPARADAGDVAGPALGNGAAALAREFLEICDEDEVERLLAEAREDRQAATEDEQAVEAAKTAWQESRYGLEWLVFSACDYLFAVPDELTKTAVRQARTELFDECGEGFSKEDFANRVLRIATSAHELRRAAEYLASLPADECAEWIAYANAAYGGKDGHLAGRLAITLPAECAQSTRRRGNWGMCGARGVNIPRCPSRATRYLRFNEFDCCQGAAEEHDQHPFCEEHSELALAGELRRGGEPVSVLSWTPVTIDPAAMAVPF